MRRSVPCVVPKPLCLSDLGRRRAVQSTSLGLPCASRSIRAAVRPRTIAWRPSKRENQASKVADLRISSLARRESASPILQSRQRGHPDRNLSGNFYVCEAAGPACCYRDSSWPEKSSGYRKVKSGLRVSILASQPISAATERIASTSPVVQATVVRPMAPDRNSHEVAALGRRHHSAPSSE